MLLVESLTGAPPPDGGLLHLMAGGGAAVGFRTAGPVRALLHPLHHQVQQGEHGGIHVYSRHCARLEVWDAEGNGDVGIFRNQKLYKMHVINVQSILSVINI